MLLFKNTFILFCLGLLCGLGSDNTLDGIDRQRRAIELSGVAEIEKKFPNGFKTDMGMVSKSSLTAGS